MNTSAAIGEIKAKLPTNTWSADAAQISAYLSEWRDRWQGRTPLLVKPRTAAHVSQIVKICAAHKAPITISGGNTGLVGGQIPQGEILLTTQYLNQIRSVSRENMNMVCEAGVTLLNAQTAAAQAGQKFPLSLASEGSCTIGGNLSTNAGGVHVVKYGTARQLCFGVEAVMANGDIFNGLSALRKDNTGYDLSQLLLGAEGTLGIITAASLKLFAKPTATIRILTAIPTPSGALSLLERARALPGLSMFELIPDLGLQTVLETMPSLQAPFFTRYPWYGLLEWEVFNGVPAPEAINTMLVAAMESGEIIDAVIAKNESEQQNLLALREHLSAAQKHLGASIKHDITVPISKIPSFLKTANAALIKAVPGCRPFPFGHMGDGNLHYNIAQPENISGPEFMAQEPRINTIIYDLVTAVNGSISAEHGIGILKKDELIKRADPVKLGAMKAIKTALDPDNIFNPRVLIS